MAEFCLSPIVFDDSCSSPRVSIERPPSPISTEGKDGPIVMVGGTIQQHVSKRNFYPLNQDDFSTGSFLWRRVSKIFNSAIKKLYGDQTEALRKIREDGDRTCEILLEERTTKACGLIVYKNNPTSEFSSPENGSLPEKCLELKTLIKIDHDDPQLGVGSALIQRVDIVARKKGCPAIAVTISAGAPQEARELFTSHGYIQRTIKNNPYGTGHGEGIYCKELVSNLKRKRTKNPRTIPSPPSNLRRSPRRRIRAIPGKALG